MIGLALLLGGALTCGAVDWAPLWTFHLVIGAIQVVIAVAYVGATVPDNDVRLFFLWATPFAAYFFTPRAAVLHGLWTASCCLLALVRTDVSPGVGLRVLLMTLGTLADVGLLVGFAAEGSRRSRRLLQHAAWHDGLSGLPNRELFERRVVTALHERDRVGGSVHVLLVDLDHFKLVNDTYGHHAGDALIRQVAPRLQAAVGATATVARMGGDEFAVVVGDPDDDRLPGLLDRLSQVWAEPVLLGEVAVPVSGSTGLVSCTEPGRGAETLLRDADVALYRAKQTRRGSVRRFDQTLRVEVERRARLDLELRGAVAREELSVVYQPVVELLTGRTVGAEALLRWHHPDLGPVSPAEFVPVAEENGLIVPVGRFVLERVARDVARWRTTGAVDGAFSVAVNVSVRQLDEDFPEAFSQLLLRHGLPTTAMTVEVTESVLLDVTSWAGSVLSRLRAAGTRVALDDFGTGYSSSRTCSACPWTPSRSTGRSSGRWTATAPDRPGGGRRGPGAQPGHVGRGGGGRDPRAGGAAAGARGGARPGLAAVASADRRGVDASRPGRGRPRLSPADPVRDCGSAHAGMIWMHAGRGPSNTPS